MLPRTHKEGDVFIYTLQCTIQADLWFKGHSMTALTHIQDERRLSDSDQRTQWRTAAIHRGSNNDAKYVGEQ